MHKATPVEPESDGAGRLSAQQARVARYLTEGCSNKVIAGKMEIAEGTVKTHLKAIISKIGVRNRTQAAIWAMRNLPPEEGEKPLELRA
jgi:two-component system nitrate/nitrite response regulator NarL